MQTRDFKEVVLENAIEDPIFRAELLSEALECWNCGEVQVGMSLLEDYLTATIALLHGTDVPSGMNAGTVLMYDHINAAFSSDTDDRFVTGAVWERLVCEVPERSPRATLATA